MFRSIRNSLVELPDQPWTREIISKEEEFRVSESLSLSLEACFCEKENKDDDDDDDDESRPKPRAVKNWK